MCACAALALCACEHKELCYHHPHTATLRLEFDWRDAPDARPEGMCVFFDHAGDFDRHIAFTREGDLFESIYGSSAGTAAPRAKDGGNERVVISPDMMWGCAAFDVEITETGISYVCVPESEKEEWAGNPVVHTEQVITLYPHELVCTYTYEIRHVKNLAHVSQMCASLSGMAPSLLFGDESLGRECVTLPFEAHTADAQTITGGFLTFGHHEENAEPHRILGAMAALMMTACSQDEVVSVKQDGVDYSVVAGKQTRAADSYCQNDLPQSFKVWPTPTANSTSTATTS